MSRRANVVRHGGNHGPGGSDPITFPSGGAAVYFGSGSPEGVVTGAVGAVYIRSNGVTGTTTYEKTSGAGNTGWTARVILGGGIVEGDLALTDITTANVSTTKHGFVPKAPNATDKFLRGDGTWAVAGIRAGWDATIFKAADESVASSTTVQDDDELTFASTAGLIYYWEAHVLYASPAGGGTPDFKYTWALAGVVVGGWLIEMNLNTADLANTISSGLAYATTASAGTGTTDRMVVMRGWFLSDGNPLRFRWAQNTSGANATIVREKSLLRYNVINA